MSNGTICCPLEVCCRPPLRTEFPAGEEGTADFKKAMRAHKKKREGALAKWIKEESGVDLSAAGSATPTMLAKALLAAGFIRSRGDDQHFLADAQMALDSGLLKASATES